MRLLPWYAPYVFLGLMGLYALWAYLSMKREERRYYDALRRRK